MGHTCDILHFETDDKKRIQAECDRWGNREADIEERGYSLCGLGSNIRFTDRVFDDIESADEYLYGTFGNYSQIAVRYKIYKATKSTKAKQDLERRIMEYRKRIAELRRPHYAGVKVKTIKCKKCGAVLPTEYCGRAFNNNCPICHGELRPQTVLEKEQSYMQTLNELEKKYNQLEKEQNKKASYTLGWAVACEVHH